MRTIRKSLILTMSLSVCLMTSALPVSALEYTYDSDVPGETFYQATSTDQDYVANSGEIVLGADGTVSTNVTGNVSSGPLSALDMPVGEYPDAWGTAVDVAIAQTSVFPNELGPTSQTTNIYSPVYIPVPVNSGALPTGYGVPANTLVGGALVSGGVMATAPGYAGVMGNYFGIATSASAMPAITRGGAIGKLTIQSIGLSKYVYDGTTQANMKKGIAHFDCTPGWGGNIAFAGHNRPASWAAFAKLKDVKMGDVVTYTTAYGTRTYVISNISTCATTDTSGLAQNGREQITMYTCKENQPEVKLKVVASLVG